MGLLAQSTLAKDASNALRGIPLLSSDSQMGLDVDEFLQRWDRQQELEGSEASDVVPAGAVFTENLNSQNKEPGYSGSYEEVWRAIQKNNGPNGMGVGLGRGAGMGVEAPLQGDAAAGNQDTLATSAVAKNKVGLSNGNHPHAGVEPFAAWCPESEPRSNARANDELQTSPEVQEGRVSVVDGVARTLGPRGAGGIGNDNVIHVSAISKWPNAVPSGGFGASGARQEAGSGLQPVQRRGSGPASSAESHPGSSTADLSHVVGLNSNLTSSAQEMPKSGGGTASRGPRQRKRKEVEVTDERTARQQKRMVKNRESAARSRLRKQQYTNSLEQQVQELRQKNKELMEQLIKACRQPEGTEEPAESQKLRDGVAPVLRRANTSPPRLPSQSLLVE